MPRYLEMKDYNKLTKKLLDEGYTEENYPEYVKVSNSRFNEGGILNNLYGGFVYIKDHSDAMIFKTGCGMYIKGEHVLSDMSYRGIDWTYENDCPTVRCPYDKTECEMNDSRLDVIYGCGLCCACHETHDPYNYENSWELADKKQRDERAQKYKDYADMKKGHVCIEHMFYDESTKSWVQRYAPYGCVRSACAGIGFCPVFGRKLDTKKGNIYYDLKITWTVTDDTFFSGEVKTQIVKAKRFFPRPVSMDICRAFLKMSAYEIADKINLEKHTAMFFNKTLKYEVLNIRAESKPSRDLMQDLQDLKDGISIAFEPDMLKSQKNNAKEKRIKAKSERIEKLEKKIIKFGYWNLKEKSLDRVHADKWLGKERIEELEKIRQEKLKHKTEQISLFYEKEKDYEKVLSDL